MSRGKTIQYTIHQDGFIVARVDSEIAWPILQWDKMLPENNYNIEYEYEKLSIFDVSSEYNLLTWTKKIPLESKNYLRSLFNMKPLKERE